MATPMPELLAPAGDLERFRTALLYGANAVYLGGETLNLRASCAGFSSEELSIAVREAKAAQAKIYYCLNNLPQERHLAGIPSHIETAASAGVHAMIVADPGILRLVRRYAPNMEIHLSTQANTANSEAVAFWGDLGVQRVNVARELSCRDIYALRRHCPDMELEVFVHGAMCLAVSGQCLLSAWLNNRPANMGRCTQPCRFRYRTLDKAAPPSSGISESNTTPCPLLKDSTAPLSGSSLAENTAPAQERIVEEHTRPGEPMWRVRTEEEYSSLWTPDDLCLLPYLPWFVGNGIHALKIEGRMRSSGYVAHVVDSYSTALAFLAGHSSGPAGEKEYRVTPPRPFSAQPHLAELFHTSVRPLCSGFFLPERRKYFSSNAAPRPILARVVEPVDAAKGAWIIEVRANWSIDSTVELILPGMRRPTLPARSYTLINHRGEIAGQVGCGTRCTLHAEHAGITPGIFIRLAAVFP